MKTLEDIIKNDPNIDYKNIYLNNKKSISSFYSRAHPETAYTEPRPEELASLADNMTFLDELSEKERQEFQEVFLNIRKYFDGRLRAELSQTNHYFAIRALNDPQRTDVKIFGEENSQLAGEEYFGVNSFLNEFPDVADIQWWGYFNNGSWELERRNLRGEHLTSSRDGILDAAMLRINGEVLNIEEIYSFARTINKRYLFELEGNSTVKSSVLREIQKRDDLNAWVGELVDIEVGTDKERTEEERKKAKIKLEMLSSAARFGHIDTYKNTTSYVGDSFFLGAFISAEDRKTHSDVARGLETCYYLRTMFESAYRKYAEDLVTHVGEFTERGKEYCRIINPYDFSKEEASE